VLPIIQLYDRSCGFELTNDFAADLAGNHENEQRSAEEVSVTTITALTDEELDVSSCG
jgi:hypothetical protein